MKAAYKPAAPFTVPIKLIVPVWEKVKGVRTKVYPQDGNLLYCSFKTYGGTESNSDGVYTVEDTANVETYYRPDIASDCRVLLPDTGAVYDIINAPENIDMRNKYCKFKVRRVNGGA